ncbi:CrcB-like protein-domain-containing protein [Biscogniauxia mediterranea]|nr:CrcB-like protein-domain-containing protein [Biscogniauxia mediterranea]
MTPDTTSLGDAEQRREARRGSAGSRGTYDAPDSYMNVPEASSISPIQDRTQSGRYRRQSREEEASLDQEYITGRSRRHEQQQQQEQEQEEKQDGSQGTYDAPDSYMNVPEVSSIPPIQDRTLSGQYDRQSREEETSLDRDYIRSRSRRHKQQQQQQQEQKQGPVTEEVSRLATELYTVSYLILFSLFGTLARLGLQALTFYPGAPVAFSSVWPNFAGSLVMGFLAEDRKLFRYEWGVPTYELQLLRANGLARDDEEGGTSSSDQIPIDLEAAKKAHVATKKTIPLYIGLATGFCGSFTSFSSFIRDVFLALSNDMPMPDVGSVTVPRNGGYSFMALLAVVIGTVSLSLSGLFVGAQLAIALEPITPSFPFAFTRKFLDRLAVFLAWGCWIGAILLSILPPDRFAKPGASEVWRGSATFALVFAPLGCLARFYASLVLNGRIPSFPLGTFAVNIFGTTILGMSWDLAHVPEGGVIGCQVLQGIEDGFCGCLTTVSTWVSELVALRRRHAYAYGTASVVVALACMIAVMGGLRWTQGFSELTCLH